MDTIDTLIQASKDLLNEEPKDCPCAYCVALRTRIKALQDAKDTLEARDCN